jgi:acetylornithine deacetylase
VSEKEHTQVIERAVEELRDDLIEFARALVRVPSLTGSEGAVQALVAETMRASGFAVDVWEPDAEHLRPHAQMVGEAADYRGRPCVVGRLAGNGGRSLLLNAHVDTVGPGDEGQWGHPLFAADIAEERLYGLGACDMKAGLAAAIFAVRALLRAGLHPRGDVLIASVIGEEDGGAGTVATLLRGYRAEAAIIPEPTGLALIPAVAGSAMFRLRVPGRSAHASVRDEGVSAFAKFCFLLQGLETYERERNAALQHPLYAGQANKIPINVGTVRGGDWPSSVPGWLLAEGRAGLLPGEDLAWFQSDFERFLRDWSARDPWLAGNPATVEWFPGQFAPAQTPADSPLVWLVSQCFRCVTGQPAAVAGATYGSDMRHLINMGGIPTLMFGPGDVRRAHFVDEFVPLAEVVTAAKVLALVLSEW